MSGGVPPAGGRIFEVCTPRTRVPLVTPITLAVPCSWPQMNDRLPEMARCRSKVCHGSLARRSQSLIRPESLSPQRILLVSPMPKRATYHPGPRPAPRKHTANTKSRVSVICGKKCTPTELRPPLHWRESITIDTVPVMAPHIGATHTASIYNASSLGAASQQVGKQSIFEVNQN